MSQHMRKLSLEEHARLGKELYEKIRPQVEPGNIGKIISIDVDTGEYEIDAKQATATDRLYARLPDAQPWVVRIGYPAAHVWGTRAIDRPAEFRAVHVWKGHDQP